MPPEQQLILSILTDHLYGRKTEPQESIDWNALQQLASSHQLSGIIFYQCQSWLKERPKLQAVYTRLREYYSAQLVYRAVRERSFEKLQKNMNEQGISYVVFKGGELSKYYPVPELRSSADIDILVHTEDQMKVHDLLVADGFAATIGENHEWGFEKKKSHFEVHDRLLFEANTNTKAGIEFCDECWQYVNPVPESARLQLDWSFHFVYLLLHMRKHILYEGIGIRQFYDLAVLMERNAGAFDWKWIWESLEKLQLERYGITCLALCEKWFGVKNPLGEYVLEESFYEKATETIFRNGVFGFQNEENDVNHIANAAGSRNLPYPLRLMKLLIGYLFPSYENMRHVKYYAFLNHRPWLLPAAWIYRLGYVIRNKFSEGLRVLKSPIGKREEIEAREQRLDSWGL